VATQFRLLIAAALILGAVGAASAQPSAPLLTLDAASRAATMGAQEARRRDAGGSIAVVDAGGHLLALLRLDETFPASADVATAKARTAALFRRPTKDFENAIKNGRHALLGVDVMTPLEGGVPLVIGRTVVGAIGVSGAHSAQEDEEIARAVAGAFTAAPVPPVMTGPVTMFEATVVSEAFAKGAPLVENAAFKVHASRRTEPGRAEIHLHDTDIIHVLDGRAEIVTGGTVVGAETIADGEIRGASIAGGEARQLRKGDVLVVPNGVPHWFTAVDGTFLYYVVKVTTPAEGGTR
jgi:glc operon protein GlcG